jgi:ariadne-1
MFEKPIDQLKDLKVDILDKTSYCTKRRIIVLNDTAENLKLGKNSSRIPSALTESLLMSTGTWKFNVDLV